MADDQTQTVDPSDQTNALVQQLLRQTLTGQSMQPTPEPQHSGDNRTWGSLLGQALVGGAGPGSTDAQNEQAGLRALQQVGLGMMSGSDYSQQRHSLGSIIANAVGGAQESNAAQIAAQQEYAQKAQEMQLARIKEAVPLLTLQQNMARLKAATGMPNPLATTPTTIAAAGTGGIGAVGAPLPTEKGPALTAIAQRESGGDPAALNYVAKADPTAYDRGATASGKYQIVNSTWREGMQLAGLDPSKYATARDAPESVQDQVAGAIWDKYGNKPWQKGGTDWVKGSDGRYALQPVAPGAPAASTDAQALPVPPIPPAQPPGVSGTSLPAGRPTGPPIITDQPADSATVAGPPGAATVGQPLPPSPAVAGNVNAIIGGMTGAGASPTTLAPGPGAAAPTAPSAIVAAATPQVAAPPPSAPIPVAAKADAELTWQEYRDQYGAQPTKDESSRFQITPDPKALADAENAKAAASQQLQLARSGMGDADKALAQYNVANDAVNKLRQEAQIQTANNQKDWFAKRDEILAANYRQARDQAAATALKTQEGQQAIDLAKVNAGQTWRQKLQEQAATDAQENTIKPMAASSLKAHQMNLGLEQMLPIMKDLPPGGGPVGAIVEAHPDLVPLLRFGGVLDSKETDAIRLINGLVSNISTEMKPQGLGALREYEWDAFKSQLPSLLSSPEGQQKAVAMLMNMNNRIQDEHSWMHSYFNRKIPDETNPSQMVRAHNLESDDPKESVQQRMDRELGPVIPRFSGPLTASGQAQWEQSLPPGKPYYKTWAEKDPATGQAARRSDGSLKTHTTLEVRPWQQ